MHLEVFLGFLRSKSFSGFWFLRFVPFLAEDVRNDMRFDHILINEIGSSELRRETPIEESDL
jgi:hypothetical protein